MVQALFLWQVVVSASVLWDFFLLLRDGSGMTISGFVNATSANFNATSDLSVGHLDSTFTNSKHYQQTLLALWTNTSTTVSRSIGKELGATVTCKFDSQRS